MRLFRSDALQLPAADEAWNAAAIGFTPTEARVLSYLSVALFFAVNALGFHLFGFAYLDGFTHLVARQPLFAVLAWTVAGLAGYYAVHELLHAVLHPDLGLSARTMIGLKAAAVFVIYNGKISRRKLQCVVLGPFLVLTPVCLVLLAGAWIDPLRFVPVVVLNLLGLHLSASAGDLLLFWKLQRRPAFSCLWNAVTSVWVK